MSESIDLKTEISSTVEQRAKEQLQPARKPTWETPKLDDVSEQVMAQPYIRFT